MDFKFLFASFKAILCRKRSINDAVIWSCNSIGNGAEWAARRNVLIALFVWYIFIFTPFKRGLLFAHTDNVPHFFSLLHRDKPLLFCRKTTVVFRYEHRTNWTKMRWNLAWVRSNNGRGLYKRTRGLLSDYCCFACQDSWTAYQPSHQPRKTV